jgi:hypothetical protein
MKTALALGCVSVIALAACAPTHSTTANVRTTTASVSSPAPVSSGTAAAVVVVAAAGGSSKPAIGTTRSSVSAPSAQPSGHPDAAGATAAPETPDRPGGQQQTAAPVATPTEIPYVAADAPPEILTFSISATTVHPGDVLSGSVTASSNVASVEVRVAGYSYNMSKTAPGEFSLAVTVPSVPRMFRRTYPLVAIARNTRGDATQRTTQITIR